MESHDAQEPKVYIIQSTTSKTCYIGSCNGYLTKRYQQHRYYYLKWMAGENYTHNYTSFFVFIEDENPECKVLEWTTKENMKKRESELIAEYKENGYNVVNMIDAVEDIKRRNQRCKRYYNKNPEKYNKKSLAYYYKNRDKILAHNKAKREEKKKSNDCCVEE